MPSCIFRINCNRRYQRRRQVGIVIAVVVEEEVEVEEVVPVLDRTPIIP